MGNVTLGTAGVILLSLAVSVSTLGSALLSIYSGSRIVYVLARDGNFMGLFSGLHKEWHTRNVRRPFKVHVHLLQN